MTNEPLRRYAHLTKAQLERLLARVEEQNGDALPGLLADVRAELERRTRAAAEQ